MESFYHSSFPNSSKTIPKPENIHFFKGQFYNTFYQKLSGKYSRLISAQVWEVSSVMNELDNRSLFSWLWVPLDEIKAGGQSKKSG